MNTFTDIKIEGFPNYEINKNGEVRNKTTGKILKSFQRSKKVKYLSVNLCNKGKMKTVYIHRLLGLIFLENPNNYKEIDHLDNNSLNNNLNNLRWCSHSENNRNKDKVRNKKGGITISNDGRKKKYKFQYQFNYKNRVKYFYTLEEAKIAQQIYKGFIQFENTLPEGITYQC